MKRSTVCINAIFCNTFATFPPISSIYRLPDISVLPFAETVSLVVKVNKAKFNSTDRNEYETFVSSVKLQKLRTAHRHF